jgi:hypothetical protein
MAPTSSNCGVNVKADPEQMSVSSAQHDAGQDLRQQAVDALVQAIRSLISAEREPTASRVRVQLRHVTRGGFDLERLGFTRFREFLEYAESVGSITIDHARQGDLAVGLPISESDRKSSSARPMRRDLWNAFVKWGGEDDRYYSRAEDAVWNIPPRPVPLEPADLAAARERVRQHPEDYVEIVPIARETQISWMQTFAEEFPEAAVKRELVDALASTNPPGAFVAVLKRCPPTELRRWYDYLASQVEQVVTTWMTDNNLEFELRREGDSRPALSRALAATSETETELTASSPNRFRISWGGPRQGAIFPPRYTFGLEASDAKLRVQSSEQLRSLIHSAIDRMPVEQLRQLAIPLGYLIDF